MKRSPTMQEIVDELSKPLFGTTQSEASSKHCCVDCGGAVDKFRDALSEKEYSISGLCQKCQDKIFGEED